MGSGDPGVGSKCCTQDGTTVLASQGCPLKPCFSPWSRWGEWVPEKWEPRMQRVRYCLTGKQDCANMEWDLRLIGGGRAPKLCGYSRMRSSLPECSQTEP